MRKRAVHQFAYRISFLVSLIILLGTTTQATMDSIIIQSNVLPSYNINPWNCMVEINFVASATTTCPSGGIQSIRQSFDFNNDNTIDTITGENFNAVVPLGTHLLRIEATDACGLTAIKSFMFHVVDSVAPVAVCQDGIRFSLDSITGNLTLWPSDFDEGSYDNCSPLDYKIALGMTGGPPPGPNDFYDSLVVDSSHATNHYVVLQVTDEAGNSNTCWSQLFLLNAISCPNDNIPPAAICDQITFVSHGLNGSTIFAQTIDDGSFDDCSLIASYEIVRLDSASNPIGSPAPSIHFDRSEVGIYQVRLDVKDEAGNSSSCITTLNIQDRLPRLKRIRGIVFTDEDQNCTFNNNEQPKEGWAIRAVTLPSGNQASASSDNQGNYDLTLISQNTDTLIRVYAVSPLNTAQGCPNEYLIDLNTNNSDTFDFDFPLAFTVGCPQLVVDLEPTLLRRCFTGGYWVNYCNYGSEIATDAYVEVTIDDFLTVTNSSIPWTSVNGQTYTFDLGDVAPGTCDAFQITTEVSCNAVLGQTHCSAAHIFPDSTCNSDTTSWSGASIELDGYCENDTVYFEIKNVGTAPMAKELNYIVIEDVIIHRQGTFQLNPNGVEVVKGLAKGRTCRLETEQEAGHPGFSIPSLAIEGCGQLPGGGISLGFVNQFSQNDNDPWKDISCVENRGSFDPNDKTASPTGVHQQHFIEQNTALEYKIRFQNTGTDTAFTVIVEDQLDPALDYETVIPGASSHLYTFEQSGNGKIRFVFNDIMLPDSNVNQAGSNGFVKFKVRQLPNNSIGTRIENEAAIFFDFNEPIITNTTYHTIGEDFLEVSTHTTFLPEATLEVFPNPFQNQLNFILKGVEALEIVFKLHSSDGRLISQEKFNQTRFEYHGHQLSPGMYFFSIYTAKGDHISSGKIIRH